LYICLIYLKIGVGASPADSRQKNKHKGKEKRTYLTWAMKKHKELHTAYVGMHIFRELSRRCSHDVQNGIEQ
jgi:hypothetical protein